MRKLIASLACAATIAAPAAASAQRGGFHGGGFHGGGFHGGGFHGGGYHGGFRGGYRGWGGYRGYGFYPYWGFGLGLGLGGLYASEFYSPWYDYYPWSYGGYGYGVSSYDYDDGSYEDEAAPPSGYQDPWNQNYSAPPPQAGSGGVAAQPSACGRWVWEAQANRYHWNNDNC
jgi:hypothetical protein